jgi:hypothetical protein
MGATVNMLIYSAFILIGLIIVFISELNKDCEWYNLIVVILLSPLWVIPYIVINLVLYIYFSIKRL